MGSVKGSTPAPFLWLSDLPKQDGDRDLALASDLKDSLPCHHEESSGSVIHGTLARLWTWALALLQSLQSGLALQSKRPPPWQAEVGRVNN